VIGVLQVTDTAVNRFDGTDLELLEPLAATASIAIENARLYERARQNAETKAVLLREVNHRVKNNLSAIIGFLYTERRHAKLEDRAVYQPIMEDLVNRVQGLATVHSMLSASEWAPLLLTELAAQVIRSSLQTLPRDKHIVVEVSPSPVRVTADQAHHLALVINELATNTVKHALQGRDTARLTVRIEVENDATPPTILFEFRDDGPGYSEEVLRRKHHNVGFELVRNIVQKTLHGEFSLHNDRGAVASVRFAAPPRENDG
jgi:two-component sensor histidine kinase